MVNRSTRSLFQDGIVLLRKWAIRMKTADIAGNPRAASSPTSCTRRGLIGHLDILNDKRNWIRENNRRAFRHCQKNWPESAGENFRGFIPLLRLPLRPGTGASRFFSGTQDVVRRSSIHPPIRPGATYNLCCCQHRVGARGLLQRRRPYLNTSKIWSLPVLKSRSRSACSSTSASTGSSMSTPGVWPNIFSMSTCRACM